MAQGYVYVTVDETGNLGISLKGERFYTLAACIVSDRKRFEEATRRLGLDEEAKFNRHAKHRMEVLEYAAPAIADVFYVTMRKNKDKGTPKHEQPEVHLSMLQALADSVVLRYGYVSDLIVEIDHKDGISDLEASALFSSNEYKARRISSVTMNSADSYGLQTNDFVVGAIGYMLNRSNHSYVKKLEKKPHECHVRSKNGKPGRDLLPLSRIQVRADIPKHSGKPPETPMRSESERLKRRHSSPMVPCESHGQRGYLKLSGFKRNPGPFRTRSDRAVTYAKSTKRFGKLFRKRR